MQSFKLGQFNISPPVVLAPMAGVTNYPFRQLCREFGAGLYVSEMVTARPLVEKNIETQKIAHFGPGETPRSLQLYGVDPYYVGQAIKRLVTTDRVDHIDLNFGCSVKKVTRKGGGAAIPLKPRLLRHIIHAAVSHAGEKPVTIKMRMGLNADYLTFIEAGKIAQEEGCAMIGLHARTAEQFYSGQAQWDAIAELKHAIKHIPVLGNGDIWEASDAMRMLAQTGCDGVIIGRGCLGRPWLFRDLVAAFEGKPPPQPPCLGEIASIMERHAKMLAAWLGENLAMRHFRKHASWYLKGFHSSTQHRQQLMQVSTLGQLSRCLAQLDHTEPFPKSAHRIVRGKTGRQQQVSLPAGYLDNLDSSEPPPASAEDPVSAG